MSDDPVLELRQRLNAAARKETLAAGALDHIEGETRDLSLPVMLEMRGRIDDLLSQVNELVGAGPDVLSVFRTEATTHATNGASELGTLSSSTRSEILDMVAASQGLQTTLEDWNPGEQIRHVFQELAEALQLALDTVNKSITMYSSIADKAAELKGIATRVANSADEAAQSL